MQSARATLYGQRDPKSPGEIAKVVRARAGLAMRGWLARKPLGDGNRIGRNAVGLVAVSAIFAATPALAVPRYDGLWSVAIVTKKGDCVASYRYPIRISNGVLVNAGALLIDVSGKVTPSGSITVTLTHGVTSAAGSGRLSGTVGSGSWIGASCSGSWTAERRS
jgi:hypothetical protein